MINYEELLKAYELRVCPSGHVEGYRREPKTILGPTCVRRLWQALYCSSDTRALRDDEVAALLLGGEEAVSW